MRQRPCAGAVAGVFLVAALAVLPGRLLAQSAATVAFIDVNVVPMDGERVVPGQTVLVRDGLIAAMGPLGVVTVPKDALRVEGRGRYLMPGLAEMHGHLPGPNVPEDVVKDLLFLFVASGVTTVRGMLGYPDSVALRERAARGEFVAPTLYVASPGFSGQSVTSAEEGARRVREYEAAGFDLLKMHEGLGRDVFDAVADTAHAVGIPFGGHVADRVGLRHAFAKRMTSIDHLDGYLEALGLDDSPFRDAASTTRAEKAVELADERKLPELARLAREAGAWNVPTLALWQTFFGGERSDAYASRPEMKYVPRSMLDQWVKARDGQVASFPPAEEGRKVLAVRDRVLKALVDAGAGVVLGSDAPQMFSVPGFSIVLREMPAMVKAGLTPYQVLRSGTRSVAEYFGTLDRTGTVAVGRQADLILLEADPLADVAHVARRAGVMVRGRWLPAAEIDARLQAIAAANATR
ncbi:MAG TPA: amidohydrolase family protein [Vicinamibacteria bacterium]|nr:amidohydrolase family protein [Vicinamibacteria bacterium]